MFLDCCRLRPLFNFGGSAGKKEQEKRKKANRIDVIFFFVTFLRLQIKILKSPKNRQL